ncbi:Flp pilus assembly protein CpaB [Fontimonas sp. SYSU GA230001]|uniref:Flp pilus assembly protein CpaB n=1 Tax=Fontimonas sp. SYSU GA230001 TaxID=3142450 RepID=UPI0032B532C0
MALRRSTLPTVLALLLGVVAAVLAARWMQQRLAAVESARSSTTAVVVAAKTIPFGERIREGDVKTVAWPTMELPSDSFSDPTQVVGRFANQKFLPGEMILKPRVVEQSAGNLLSTMIEPNMRAVTVRVNDVIGVAGFLLPGNRVDVLATRMNEQRRAETRTLLQNLRVLAVDQTTAQAGKDEPVVVRAVTLEMSPEQAELLVSATEEGTVQLALRNPDDTSVAVRPAPPSTIPLEEPPPAAAAPAPAVRRAAAPKAPPPKDTVTVIRQAQTSEAETNK